LARRADARVTWVVKGGGFGHGVGLSAYGAYGYGLHGYGYRQILHHYFRDIRITTLQRAPMVRVLLTVSPGDVGFSNATAACGRRLDPSRPYRAHLRGSSVRLLSSSGKLLARCGGRLHADSGGKLRIAGLGVYRGSDYPSLDGVYFFGDWGSGRVWGLKRDDAGKWQMQELLHTALNITSGNADETGQIFVTNAASQYGTWNPFDSAKGSVWKLVSADKVASGAKTAPAAK